MQQGLQGYVLLILTETLVSSRTKLKNHQVVLFLQAMNIINTSITRFTGIFLTVLLLTYQLLLSFLHLNFVLHQYGSNAVFSTYTKVLKMPSSFCISWSFGQLPPYLFACLLLLHILKHKLYITYTRNFFLIILYVQIYRVIKNILIHSKTVFFHCI